MEFEHRSRPGLPCSCPPKLYPIYAPPQHRDGVVHRTRADAEADGEHFDGKPTE
jgi:hypothetical protein